jgi:hypothetical protein
MKKQRNYIIEYYIDATKIPNVSLAILEGTDDLPFHDAIHIAVANKFATVALRTEDQ